jgi:hypothetical protein
MHRKGAIALVTALLVFTQTTCKTTFKSGDLTVEELCEIMNDFICSYLNSCCTSAELEQVLVNAPMGMDVNCNDVLNSGWYQGCVANLRLSVDSGNVELIDEAMPSCESGLGNLVGRCPNFTPFVVEYLTVLGTICSSAVVGTIETGDECYNSFDCVLGYCDEVDSTCRPFIELGGTCTYNSQCAGPYSCIQGECAPLSSGGDTGGPCDPDDQSDCEKNAFCDGTTCVNLKPAGEPCSEVIECLGACDRTNPDAPVCVDLCNGI